MRPAHVAMFLTVSLAAREVLPADHPQEARVLRLKQSAANGQGTLAWSVKLPPPVLPTSDPRAVGGTLRVIGVEIRT